MEASNSSNLLVIGLGVCTGVIALVGVDGFCCSNLLDILLVIGLGVETEVILLVGVANGSSSEGCSCIGLVALLDGTTVTFFLALFLFGFGGAGGGASDS